MILFSRLLEPCCAAGHDANSAPTATVRPPTQAIARGHDDLLVMFGDTPLIETTALDAARAKLAEGASVAVMGFRTENPTGYGRLIERDGELVAIREERDCTDEERKITFCNGGLMAIDGRIALSLLEAVGNDNAVEWAFLGPAAGEPDFESHGVSP